MLGLAAGSMPSVVPSFSLGGVSASVLDGELQELERLLSPFSQKGFAFYPGLQYSSLHRYDHGRSSEGNDIDVVVHLRLTLASCALQTPRPRLSRSSR